MVKATKSKGSANAEEQDPELILYDYLQKQNRPFGANDIFQNLHGTIGKTAITKLLTGMADKGKITSKTFGKSVIYFPNQAESELLSEEAAEQLENEISQAKLDLDSLKMKFQTKQKVFQTLKSSLTTTDIQLRINQLEVENEKFTTRLSKLNEGTEIVDPVARQLLESTLKSYKSAWSSKKRRVKDAVDLITEQLDKKPTEFMEDIGIETDEMIGLDITQVFDIKRAIFND